ncbi:MAG TPA: hypothetical protein VL094_12335 [Sphingomonadaceae bacterium]|nr:hypothetical protein [Sphingomonadaceae bacterium]
MTMTKMKFTGVSLGLAAMLAAAAQPAMAQHKARSGDSLPRHSYASAPAAISGSGSFAFGPQRNFPRGFNSGGGFFQAIPLPPRILTRLENFFVSRGFENPALCRIFAFSYCDDNDSPG